MAIYHCSVKTISRGQGRSAVGAVAYRAGEKLYNSYDGILHDYTRKRSIEYSEIILTNNAPKEYLNREKLWNSVELAEKRINSRTAREVEVALPLELSIKQQIELVKEYAKENFINKGMCVDFSIHDKADGNPHAHIMLTTRNVSQDGFTSKNREWDKKENLEQWRENWEIECNKILEKYGFEERIDHRSYKAQGINKQPTIHLGAAAKMKESDRGRINEEIKKINKEIDKLINEQIPKPISMAEEKAKRMHNLKVLYLKTDSEIQRYNELRDQIQRGKLQLDNTAEKIIDKTNTIVSYNSQIKELTEKKQALGLFKGKNKKQLEEQIKRLESTMENMKRNLYLEFNITPEQATDTINGITNKYKELSSKMPPSENLEQLKRQLFIIELKYKIEKLLIEESPEKQHIEELLKQRRSMSVNMHDTMKVAKMESKLNHITQCDLKLIAQQNPHNVQLAQIVHEMQQQLSFTKKISKDFTIKR